MHYGLNMVTLGGYADPRPVVKLAQAAETAGWESIFVWDHLAFAWGVPSGDPWVILAAVAQATKTLNIGTAVTPLPRRRPHVIANTVSTLDLLSEGRVILGAGLGGVPQEFSAFGDEGDARIRAQQLDESLDLLCRLWSGESVTHSGTHYSFESITLAPLPVQRPRVPVWIGGESSPALRRAARWDGWVMGGDNEHGEVTTPPARIAECVTYIEQHRTESAAFDVAVTGTSEPGDTTLVQEYSEAGASWWLESLHGFRGDFDALLARVQAGPPVIG